MQNFYRALSGNNTNTNSQSATVESVERPLTLPSPPLGERVAEGRVRGGARSIHQLSL